MNCAIQITSPRAMGTFRERPADGSWIKQCIENPAVVEHKDNMMLWAFLATKDGPLTCHWDGSPRRGAVNLGGYWAICVDYDHGVQWDDVVGKLPCRHLAYTSPKHDPDGEHRFRVLVPLAEFLPGDLMPYAKTFLREFFAGCDKTSFDQWHLQRMPAVLIGKEHLYRHADIPGAQLSLPHDEFLAAKTEAERPLTMWEVPLSSLCSDSGSSSARHGMEVFLGSVDWSQTGSRNAKAHWAARKMAEGHMCKAEALDLVFRFCGAFAPEAASIVRRIVR